MKTYEQFCEAYSAPEKDSHKASKRSFMQSISSNPRPAMNTQSKAPEFKAAKPNVNYSQKTAGPKGVNKKGGAAHHVRGAI